MGRVVRERGVVQSSNAKYQQDFSIQNISIDCSHIQSKDTVWSTIINLRFIDATSDRTDNTKTVAK